MAKAASAKDHAGLGRIHPKDRNDASDRADQQRRRAAQPLVDPLGDQNLVGGSRPRRWALVSAHHLGAIALADALDQGLPFGKLLGRGRRRLDRHRYRLAHANSLSAIQSSPSQLRTTAQTLACSEPPSRREKVSCVSQCNPP
jgi:hypothetical protein